mgnify:CR=1 FL=1
MSVKSDVSFMDGVFQNMMLTLLAGLSLDKRRMNKIINGRLGVAGSMTLPEHINARGIIVTRLLKTHMPMALEP